MSGGLDYFEHEGFKKAQPYPKDMASIFENPSCSKETSLRHQKVRKMSELNPCEQIWKQLRRTHLSNRSFKDEEELLSACSDAWNDFTKTPETVSSLCHRQWAKL